MKVQNDNSASAQQKSVSPKETESTKSDGAGIAESGSKQYSSAQLIKLSVSQLNKLGVSQLNKLQAPQLNKLNSSQVAKLNAAQLSKLSPAKLASLGAAVLDKLGDNIKQAKGLEGQDESQADRVSISEAARKKLSSADK